MTPSRSNVARAAARSDCRTHSAKDMRATFAAARSSAASLDVVRTGITSSRRSSAGTFGRGTAPSVTDQGAPSNLTRRDGCRIDLAKSLIHRGFTLTPDLLDSVYNLSYTNSVVRKTEGTTWRARR